MDIPQWLSNTIGDVDLSTIIVWITIATLIFIGIRRAWPALRTIVKAADLWAQLGPFMTDTTATIEKLRRQVENDHQTNLRDELTSALEQLHELRTSVDGMHGRMDSVEASNERQEQAIGEVRDDVGDLRGVVVVVQEKLTNDHQRLNTLEDTLPADQARQLTQGDTSSHD